MDQEESVDVILVPVDLQIVPFWKVGFSQARIARLLGPNTTK